ncbi:MAG: YwaF family protein, partial [Candidatus Izimaplasma sp.]|nr:YwaF family protein [Candidatus Izimaplasma bacterium]
MFLDYFTYYLYVLVTFFVIYIFIFKNDFAVKHKKEIFYLLLAMLFYTQYRRYGSRLFSGTFEYTIESLPIHFCRMSAVMTLLYLLTKNKIIKGFVFFQSGLGFLSVIFPGGLFFVLPYDWRTVTYLFDHFSLAIMPVFLVFLMDYVPNKRDFRISMIYSLVVPLLVLPIALYYDYNAYYVLDGVFIRDVVGDNQFLIMGIMLILLVMYNYLMWYIGLYLVKLKEKK